MRGRKEEPRAEDAEDATGEQRRDLSDVATGDYVAKSEALERI
jgi:hypothetical protein